MPEAVIVSTARTPIGRASAKAVTRLAGRGRARLIPFGARVAAATRPRTPDSTGNSKSKC